MVEKTKESEILTINGILFQTIVNTLLYAKHWDSWAKCKAFNHMTWEVVSDFSDLKPSLIDSELSRIVDSFLETCRTAKEQDPNFHSMESDAALKAFQNLVLEINDSGAAKKEEWSEEKRLVSVEMVERVIEVMDALAGETEETIDNHQLAMPSITVIK